MVNDVLSSFFTTLNISILGPLLFLIFINDMFKSNALFNFLFADYTTSLKNHYRTWKLCKPWGSEIGNDAESQ